MSVRLYADVHVRRAVTEGLRLRAIDILTAQEDGAAKLLDPELLTRATELGRSRGHPRSALRTGCERRKPGPRV